jgi:hypothetical protein
MPIGIKLLPKALPPPLVDSVSVVDSMLLEHNVIVSLLPKIPIGYGVINAKGWENNYNITEIVAYNSRNNNVIDVDSYQIDFSQFLIDVKEGSNEMEVELGEPSYVVDYASDVKVIGTIEIVNISDTQGILK